MDDLISKQAAIDALNDEYHGMISDESMKIYQIIDWLNDLPPAQPERERGKWIRIHWKGFRCSRCNRMNEYFTNFCPECGAKMEG